jgi:8-oxo-dGTP pyrophosphatase MutT (NUDIX family)
MSYLERIAECNAHDLGRYLPWSADGRRVGHVRRDRVGFLLAAGGFELESGGEGLRLLGESFAERSARLAAAMAAVHARGAAPAPRGEVYPLAAPLRSAPLAEVDRAHVAWLGVAAAGVHVNGFVRTGAGLEMWIGVRARDKPTFPGQLDNMVAGGQPRGLGLRENLVKECAEEAGIPAELAARAVPVGAVRYVFENESGLKPDTMFCFDLELPEDFVPVCQDGEVERFERLRIAEVAELVAGTRRFKFNCNLVVIDFLVRHGLIEADEPGYLEIVDGLWQPLRP